MATKETPEQVTAAVVRTLYEAGANKWSIQDKGVLVAAVKLQLTEQVEPQEGEDGKA